MAAFAETSFTLSDEDIFLQQQCIHFRSKVLIRWWGQNFLSCTKIVTTNNTKGRNSSSLTRRNNLEDKAIRSKAKLESRRVSMLFIYPFWYGLQLRPSRTPFRSMSVMSVDHKPFVDSLCYGWEGIHGHQGVSRRKKTAKDSKLALKRIQTHVSESRTVRLTVSTSWLCTIA